MDRYTRQERLADVGPEGQRRIEAARADVRGRQGALIETAYLTRAGVRHLTLSPLSRSSRFVHEQAFRFEATRAVASGAWRALSKIKSALDGGPRR